MLLVLLMPMHEPDLLVTLLPASTLVEREGDGASQTVFTYKTNGG